MTNEQLVARIQAGENASENIEQLYLQVKDFIRSVAWKYRDSGELEDLEQEGYLALYPAIDGYDSSYGVKFLTYAEKWINQRIRRYLDMNGSCLHIPIRCRQMIQRYKRFTNDFLLKYGREPSAAETARLMGLSLEQVRNIQENACLLNLASLDAPVTGVDGGEDTSFGDLLAADGNQEEEITEKLNQEELHAVLWGCVDELPGQQPEAIRLRYGNQLTVKAVGQQMGATEADARHWIRKSLCKLRGDSRLKPFKPEYERIYSMALVGNGVERFNRTWTSSTERAALMLLEP